MELDHAQAQEVLEEWASSSLEHNHEFTREVVEHLVKYIGINHGAAALGQVTHCLTATWFNRIAVPSAVWSYCGTFNDQLHLE